jgi:hypothetical protein
MLRLAMAALVVAVFSTTEVDVDLWGHLRFGHDMVAAHALRLPDRYSFLSDRPWVNHEWLAEAIMYGAYAAGGSLGLILLKLGLLLAMLAAVVMTLRPAALPDARRDLLLGLVVASTVPQSIHVRPQLFSLALFAWLLALLVRSDGAPLALLLAVPIMLVWANVHGGWLVGAGVLAAWVTVSVVRRGNAREKAIAVVAVLLALAATVINPHGWRLWQFLRETVGLSRSYVLEWQPVFHLGLAGVALWALVASAAAVLILRAAASRSLDPRAVLVVLLLAAASMRVNRLGSFFAISVVLLLGRHLSAGPRAAPASRRVESGRASRISAAVACAAALAVLVGSVVALARHGTCIRMTPEQWFPDQGVVDLVNERGLRGRMLTWFDYGEYAIWYWGDRILVSMDGRRETVYSDRVIRQHERFYFRPEERRAILDSLRPDFILLPVNLEVVGRLESDGWRPLFSGGRSVLLARRASTGQDVVQAEMTRATTGSFEAPGPRCFPGP